MTWERQHEPGDERDYQLDWGGRLGDERLTGCAWTIVAGAGLVIVKEAFNDRCTGVWLTGGTAGTTYELRNRVTTSGGDKYEQTIRLLCRRPAPRLSVVTGGRG